MTASDLRIAPHFGFDLLKASASEAESEAARAGDFLARRHHPFAETIVKTSMHAGHRFDRCAPWAEKRKRASRSLAPLARACRDAGLPLGIENHGDYYCSGLVELCEETPHLYIFLDTGNTYLIGERPDLAIAAAAPWTIGTHFKDHRVRPLPDSRPLGFEVEGSPLGEGDVPLRECYALLREKAPWPDRLVMEMEMIAPTGMDPLECFMRSLAFVRSLDKHNE
ncbi:MAG: sugar phosphate isomerase/epimerase family protein [Opitutaceae bacterium]